MSLNEVSPTEPSNRAKAPASASFDVSIVIPTRNRCRQLAGTLQRIEELRVPDAVRLEVIVVDNGSADETEAAVARYAGASRYRVRCVRELAAGRGCACNAGIAAAAGSLIAFLDDDVYPRVDWLEEAWKEFQSNPDLAALASRMELANPLDLPLMLVLGAKRAVVQKFLDADGTFTGNMVLRREVVEAVGRFDPDFGTGGRFKAEEDMDYYYRVYRLAQRSRWRMLYTPAAVLLHDHGRRTPAAKRKLLYTYNFGIGAFYAKHLLRGDAYMLRLMGWKLLARLRWMLRGHEWAETTRAIFWLLAGFASYAGLWLRRRVTGAAVGPKWHPAPAHAAGIASKASLAEAPDAHTLAGELRHD